MSLSEILAYEFVRNAVMVAVLASLLCGLVGTFVVIKRLVFISGGVSHAAFGGLGICHFFGLPPLLGAGAAAVLTALLVSRADHRSGRSRDALIGILWAVGMAVGVVFIARTPGYAPNLTTYLFGDILAVSRPLVIATAVLVALVLACVSLLFKELVAVSFDEEFARAQGLPVRRLLMLLMVVIALSVVLLIQAVGVILSIALLTIPPTISLSTSQTFRGVMVQATLLGLVMTLGGLAMSFAWGLPSGPTIVLVGFAMLLLANLRRAIAMRRRVGAAVLLVSGATAMLACSSSVKPTAPGQAPARGSSAIRHLDFLGEAVVPPLDGDDVPMGGLSGITWDAERDLYYVISDDRAERGPAHFYTLEIDLGEGRLEPSAVRAVSRTDLTLPDGAAFGRMGVDPEGIALAPDGALFISSEGSAATFVPPFVREFSLDGRQVAEFPLGERYAPRRDRQWGVRDNLALESAAVSPDGQWLFTATENALVQDGPESTPRTASPARILRFDTASRSPAREYLYLADPVAHVPTEGDFAVSGVVELLALDGRTLLVLERSFSRGVGNRVRIYQADLSNATEIQSIESLEDHGLEGIEPVTKRLLLDVGYLGIEPDNLEGMTLGPLLPDGDRTLLLVADDNFNPAQRSQLLAFALRRESPTIRQIQGAGHRSPLEGDWVRGVEGVVTAVDADTRRGGFWMQQAGDPETEFDARSAGIYIHQPAPEVVPGDVVRVDGGVRENGFGSDLTVTRLVAGRVDPIASGASLPTAVVIGAEGRLPPAQVIDDDGMQRFEPCCDGIDFYESLEGMRVRVNRPLVVGGTSRYGEIAVVPDGGEHAGPRSPRGGIVLGPGDANPERILLQERLTPDPPSVGVGALLTAPVSGVLDYSFGNFKLLVESWPAGPGGPEAVSERTTLPPTALSVASYNVLNLDPGDGPEVFARLAGTIVEGLGSPDLLGLQEVQDDTGPTDDGVTAAGRTLDLLAEAIVAAGGPHYEFRQIDPEDNADGGQPGGNIRVAWLFRTDRLRWLDRGTAGPTDSVDVRTAPTGGVELTLSPGRIAPEHPAFAGDPVRGWEGGRKCLAGEAIFQDSQLFLINCHLKSKRGDDGLFGGVQPPVFGSEQQRTAQVLEIAGIVERVLTTDPDAAIVVLGDMNEHDFRPPMQLLAGNHLENLTLRLPTAERYSYNYQGNSQLLDHILVSPALAARTEGVRIPHLNADLPDSRRVSDHDPVLAWFDLD